jgi:hypothetical protein
MIHRIYIRIMADWPFYLPLPNISNYLLSVVSLHVNMSQSAAAVFCLTC